MDVMARWGRAWLVSTIWFVEGVGIVRLVRGWEGVGFEGFGALVGRRVCWPCDPESMVLFCPWLSILKCDTMVLHCRVLPDWRGRPLTSQ